MSEESKSLRAFVSSCETKKEEATPALVPKLRFPEFRGADGWKQETLSAVAMVVMGSSPKSEGYNESQNGLPLLQGNADIKNRLSAPRVFTSEITKECQIGDILMSVRAPVGSVAKSVHHACIGRGIAAIHSKQPNSQEFLYQWLLSYEHRWVNISQGGTFDAINSDDLRQVGLTTPSPAEQQKIAECLSSVDELMAAQARKVDALKTHKRGLMQQLFPREGETQLRLRFPEFQNAGEWDVRTIGDMFHLINGCAFKPEDWKPSGTPIIRIQNLNDPSAEFNYSQAPVLERNRIESGDLLFAWSGTLGSSFGARVWKGPSGVLNQHIFKVLMDEQQITLQFALLVLARVEEDIAKKSHGFKASFVHVKKSDLVKVDLRLPSLPEQQRIASCLSSLDALITAETQKLEALKTHKKGLMQQLFPTPEAVEA